MGVVGCSLTNESTDTKLELGVRGVEMHGYTPDAHPKLCSASHLLRSEKVLAMTLLSPAPRERRTPYLQRSMRLFSKTMSNDSRVARPESCVVPVRRGVCYRGG